MQRLSRGTLIAPFDGATGLLRRLAFVWQKMSGWFVAVLAALAAIALDQTGLFRVLDGMAFDVITIHEAPRPPRVVIIDSDPAFELRGEARHGELARGALALGMSRVVFLADPKVTGLPADRIIVGHRAERVPGKKAWRLARRGIVDSSATYAASTIAAPEYGIFRRQFAGLQGLTKPIPTLETAASGGDPSAPPYFVRMPRSQNVPRISASQLLNGELAAREVKGLIALVSPHSQIAGFAFATPLNTGGQAMPEVEFRALAMQTIADERAVRPTLVWQAALLVLGLCLATAAFYRRFDPKRVILAATGAIAFALVGGTYLLLQFFNILLPITSLLLSQGLLAALIIHRSETGQDRLLSRQVDRALSVAFKRGSFDNQSRLPAFLLDSARMLDVRHMLLLERDADGGFAELGAIHASMADIKDDKRVQSRHFDEARHSFRTCRAGDLVPEWEGPVWIAWLGGAEHDIYWLYSLAGTIKQRRGERLAAAMVGSYRELQSLRASLSAGAGRRWSFQSIDDKVTSALDLITGHDEQIRNGIDALNTSVMVFHLLGYPLHANAAMVGLLEEAELSLVDTTLQEAIAQLSQIEPETIVKMLHELLFRGGEMRVPCRSLGGKTLILRIAAPFRVARGSERVIILEVIDISKLKRLADLRLSVSTFIDSQLRNDLEAITLGASIAGDGGQNRVINLIAKAAERAMRSLEEVAVHLSHPSDDVLGLAYPIDVGEIAKRAIAKAQGFADDMQVSIRAELPGISGFTIAEPLALEAMLEAMLLLTIAETQPGDGVDLDVKEERDYTRIHVRGGFGISFESLCNALDSPDAGAPLEYKAITTGIRLALGWKANISYWSEIGKGYRFTIELRRIA